MKANKFLVMVFLCLTVFAISNNVVLGQVSDPAPHYPIPTEQQYNYQSLELTAFIHFGMNTFTDVEWGSGKEDPRLFNPTELDAEQWVTVLKEAGFKQIILVAKHHDGFCLWPSTYTEHSVKNSPWKNGQGDVVKELSDACHKYGVKFGIYISPWDANSPYYGQGEAYNDYFVNQLTELLTNYGEISEVWFDGAKGTDVEQEYDVERWIQTIRKLQPNCIIWSPIGPDARWAGNEQGIAGDPMWAKIDIEKLSMSGNSSSYLNTGEAYGNTWMPAECDVSIRPGWFYHASQDNQVKSLEKLLDIYYKSVGRNSVLLLNVPPDKRGLIHDNDIARLQEFKRIIDETFKTDLAFGATVTADSVRGNDTERFGPVNVIDGDDGTYWATDDGVTTGSLELDFGKEITFDVINIQEYIKLGQRVSKFNIEAWDGSEWYEIFAGTTIGYKRLARIAPVTSSKIRINILESQACPLIKTVGVYKQPKEVSESVVPKGATIIDDFDTGTGLNEFEFSSGWRTGTSSDHFDSTEHYTTNTNDYFQIRFTGTKIYLFGAVDPNHGIMSISIDGGAPFDVDTYSPVRKTRTLIYESPDLSPGEHIIRVSATGRKNPNAGKADLQIDRAAVLNNEYGTFEFAASEFTVNEAAGPVEITINRVGGSTGQAEVDYLTRNGTAISGTDYQEWSGTLFFDDGETSKSFIITIINNKVYKGDRYFTVELSNATGGAGIGFRDYAKVTILEDEKPLDFDVNNDGKINVGDLGIISKFYGFKEDNSYWETARKADVDGNGAVEIIDLVLTANAILKK